MESASSSPESFCGMQGRAIDDLPSAISRPIETPCVIPRMYTRQTFLLVVSSATQICCRSAAVMTGWEVSETAECARASPDTSSTAARFIEDSRVNEGCASDWL